MKTLISAGIIRGGVLPLGAFSPVPGPIPQAVRRPSVADVHCRRCLTRQNRATVDAGSLERHEDEHGAFESALCLSCKAKEAPAVFWHSCDSSSEACVQPEHGGAGWYVRTIAGTSGPFEHETEAADFATVRPIPFPRMDA